MNEIQKKYLSSYEVQIKTQAFNLAVYEVLSGKEDEFFWQELLSLNVYRVMNGVKVVLDKYPRRQKLALRFIELARKYPDTAVFEYLLQFYASVSNSKIQGSCKSLIAAYPLSASVILSGLLEYSKKGKDFDEVIVSMINNLKEKSLEAFYGVKGVPARIWEYAIGYLGCKGMVHFLREVPMFPASEEVLRWQNLIEKAVLSDAGQKWGCSCLQEVLFNSNTYGNAWKYALLMQVLEKGTIGSAVWDKYIVYVADMIASVETYGITGVNAKRAWNDLERVLRIRCKRDLTELPQLIALVDKTAQKLAAEKACTPFFWFKPGMMNANRSGFGDAVRFELWLIKQLLSNTRRDEKTALLLPQINLWLLKLKGGKTLTAKRDEALLLMEGVKDFQCENLLPFVSALRDLDEDVKPFVEAFYNRLISFNESLFKTQEETDIDLIEEFDNYCRRENIRVSGFTCRYAYELNNIRQERRNIESILAELSLPEK